VTEPTDRVEPTDEDIAAIAAIIFSEQAEPIQEPPPQRSPWLTAARREAVETWEQPTGLSRLQNMRDR
jgi:hypothetical protein